MKMVNVFALYLCFRLYCLDHLSTIMVWNSFSSTTLVDFSGEVVIYLIS